MWSIKMELKVYNSQSQQKEVFQTITPGQVKMYCCGPTVYDFLHVGNFRGAVFYNFVRNWLVELGYQVSYAYNFTDVDDKILNRASQEGVSAQEISERFIKEFWQDFHSLKLTPHSHNPKVTEYMSDIIQLIETLIVKERAYVVDGEVFYSIDSFAEYGKLSHRRPEDMQSGSRVEVDPKKRSPLDFTLWKPAKKDEQSWDSPWGPGRPGWHIECSAMTQALLGEQIDIHGGGMDLIFPHHENEIAQSEGASDKPYVRYWLHNNMFTFSGAKMSKSLGNIRTMRSFLEKYNGEIFKYLVLSVHYRSEAEFSDTTISHAVAALGRVYSALSKAQSYMDQGEVNGTSPEWKKMKEQIDRAETKIKESFNDDFGTPQAMAQLFDTIRLFNQMVPAGAKAKAGVIDSSHLFHSFISQFGRPLSLFQEEPDQFLKTLDDLLLKEKGIQRADVDQLVEQRVLARQNKDYQKSDQVRDQLVAMGIELRDTPDGTVWEVRKGH
jgi:cysteinyl-tRNA synthetase